VLIGSQINLVEDMLERNIDSVILGFLFIFIGLFSIFIFFKRFKQKAFFPFTFGAFSICIGLFYVIQNPMSQLLFNAPIITYYLGFAALRFFPGSLYAFFEYIVGARYKKIVRRLWQLHLIYALVVIILDLTNILPLPVGNDYFLLFFMASILITFYIGSKAAFSGNIEAKVFMTGFLVFGLSGLYDILAGLRVIPHWHWMSQWGALVFILTLAYILERRFNENHNRLQVYSKELEVKSKELEEYSHTLEQKVEVRTQDLNQKNKELESTLNQLKATQNHLVLREKMASLGNLVAGVAHEVNNPIGAINSAADVSARCINKISDVIESSETIDELENNKNLQKLFKILKDNNQIAVTAGDRVAKIVRTLKNFARLDEAELQKANLHEGIDSTLTLVHHKLKNKISVIKNYGEIPQVYCYPNQLNQVFINLFVNAAQAIEDKGTIKIKTFADNGYVHIKISDSGKGIPPENIDKIFDPGFTTKGRGVGTGLGLSICYNIIQKHNGKIKVESEVGKGTEFIITLPIKQN